MESSRVVEIVGKSSKGCGSGLRQWGCGSGGAAVGVR